MSKKENKSSDSEPITFEYGISTEKDVEFMSAADTCIGRYKDQVSCNLQVVISSCTVIITIVVAIFSFISITTDLLVKTFAFLLLLIVLLPSLPIFQNISLIDGIDILGLRALKRIVSKAGECQSKLELLYLAKLEPSHWRLEILPSRKDKMGIKEVRIVPTKIQDSKD